MSAPLRVGAVMYDPKVSVIWEIIGDFFESRSCPIDVTFYSTYELQVTALVDSAIDMHQMVKPNVSTAASAGAGQQTPGLGSV